MADCIHSRTPYEAANQAKKERTASNRLRMSEKAMATSATVIDAAAMNSRGSSL
jgi:hypothetical protein